MKTSQQEMVVCFLDILGFEKRSLNEPEEAEEAARNFRQKLKENILLASNDGLKKSGKRRYLQVPQFSVISDSVFISLMMLPKDESKSDLEWLVRDLSDTLLECLEVGIPLRGSISIGKAYYGRADREGIMSGDHLVGVPVTQAAVFEHKQEWVGVSFVPELYGNEPVILNYLIDKGVVAEWGVPTESGLQNTWVVKWPEKELEAAIDLFKGYYDDYLKPEEAKPIREVAAKYYSTLVFLKHQKKKLNLEVVESDK